MSRLRTRVEGRAGGAWKETWAPLGKHPRVACWRHGPGSPEH